MVYIKEVTDESILYDGKTPINIKIDSIIGMNAYERGVAITEELFNIQYPHLSNTNQTIFPVNRYDNGDVFMMIDVSYQMKVQPNVSFDRLISLFPNLSQDEIDELINYIQTTGTFIFRNIIPKDTKFYFIEWVDE